METAQNQDACLHGGLHPSLCPAQFAVDTLKVFLHRLPIPNHFLQSICFWCLTSMQNTPAFCFLKSKPGTRFTQSMEVKLLVLLNNADYPSASSSLVFSLVIVYTLSTWKRTNGLENSEPNWKHYNKNAQKVNNNLFTFRFNSIWSRIITWAIF